MSEPFIAEIIIFAGNFAPRAWTFCHGQTMPISSNTALFSLVGTTYGGDGRTTLGIPALRGRTAIHAGNGPGLTSRRLGARGGSATTTLQATQLASHNHTASATIAVNEADGGQRSPGGNYPAKTGSESAYSTTAAATAMAAGAVGAITVANSTGGGTAVNNYQPYLGLNYILCTQGIYPSRS